MAESGRTRSSGIGERPRWQRVIDSIDWLIPTTLLEQGAAVRLRARLILLAPIPFLVAAVPASIDYYSGGSPLGAAFIAAFSLCALLTPLVMRLGIDTVAHFQLGLFLAVISILTWLSGGLGSPPLYAYALLPMVTVAVLGRRAAVAWSLAACCVVLAFLGLDLLGQVPQPEVTEEAMLRGHAILGVVGISVALAFSLLQDVQRSRAFQELDDARVHAEAASRAKGAFLASVSHELRTPMNGVLGMSSLLENADLGREHLERVEVIRSSAESLLVLLDDILDYTEIESGRVELCDEPFDPRALVGNVVKLLAPMAAEKGLEFVCETSEAMPWLRGDEGRIRQILINLLGNAIKFTERGRVVLRSSFEAPEYDGPGTWTLRVEDTGPGIPESARQRIFERFVRLDDSSTRRHPGTGLGLSICSGLVEHLGGEISVDSEPGAGSRFEVRLPLAVAEARSHEPLHRPRGEGIRVLLVDESLTNRLVVERMLEELECRVSLVDDGARALAWLERECCDVIFIDCDMRIQDALATTRTIRLDPQLASLPVIGIATSSTSEDRHDWLYNGMDQILSRPCSLVDLSKTLADYMEKRQS